MKLPMAMAASLWRAAPSEQRGAARRPRARERVLGVARAARPRIRRHLPRVPPDAPVVLAQVGGQIAAVIRTRVADRPEGTAPVPHQPAPGQGVEVLAADQLAQLALEAALGLGVGDRGAELTAEDDADGHEPRRAGASRRW